MNYGSDSVRGMDLIICSAAKAFLINTYYFFVSATSTVCSLAFVARIDLQNSIINMM